jgi:hypothetical protein
VDGGFESAATPALNLPNTPGVWAGDMTTNVTAQNSITPFEGARMIRFDAATSNGGMYGPIGSEIWQIVDLGQAINEDSIFQADAEAWFNRIAGEEGIDTQFSIVLSAYCGDPADFSTMWMNAELSLVEGFAYTDSNVESWEVATASMIIPEAADFLVLRITATENVYDDNESEFWGHYADAVSLRITQVPAPATAAMLLLGAGGIAGRRRRSIA